MEGDRRRRRLIVRVLRAVGLGLCIVVGLLIFAVGAALIGVNSAPGRRFVVAKVNQILLPLFQGRIDVEGLSSLGIFGISGANATIFDPTGKPVLVLRDGSVRITPWAIAASALFGKHEPLTITVSDVSIGDLDVLLDTDPSGQLDLMNAVAAKTPSESKPSNPGDRGLRVDVGRFILKHAWGHGTMAGAPPLDVTIDKLEASLSYTPDRLRADLPRANIIARHLANGADLAGLLEAHVDNPMGAASNASSGANANEALSAITGRVAWHGTAGTLAHSLEASLDKGKVNASVDAPSFDPESVRGLWPGSTITSPGSLHIQAHGTLPAIDIDLHAGLGEGTLTGQGQIVITDDKKATLSLVARDVDAHQFALGAPTSRLGLTLELSGSQRAAGAIDMAANLHFLGGPIGSEDVPAADIHATGGGPSAKELRAHADVEIHEPSAPTHITLDAAPSGRSYVLDATVESDAPDLSRVPQLKRAVSGTMQVGGNAIVDLAPMSIDAHLIVAAANVAQGATTLKSVLVQVHAWGPLAGISLDAAIHGRGLVAGGRHVTSFDVLAIGTQTHPRVTASALGPDIPTTDASVNIDLEQGMILRSLHLGLSRAGERATLTVDSVRTGTDGLHVEGARIEGLGWPATFNFEQNGEAMHVRAMSQGIDLGRIGRLVHIEQQLSSGSLSIDADTHLAPRRASGRATIDLSGATLSGVHDISVHLDAAIAGPEVKAKLSAKARELGSLDVDAPKVNLGQGGVLSLSSWRQAWGHVSFEIQCDLARVLELIPPDDRPFGEAHGQLSLEGHLDRDDRADLTPDVQLSFKTEGLALAPNTPRRRDIDGVMVVGPPAWHLQGVDFDGNASVNGDAGLIAFETKASDRKGELVQVKVTLPRFPFRDVFDEPARLNEDMRSSPFDVRLAIPERGLGGLPDILKQDAVTGRLTADVHATGTLFVPHVDLKATLHDPHFARETEALPMDLTLAVHYDGKRGTLSLKAGSEDQPVVDASSAFDAEFAQLFDAQEALDWSASARAHFSGFPLAAIPALDAKLISGKLSGDLALNDLHKNATATADLSVDSLRVGNVDYKSARIQAKTDGRAFDGKVHIDQTDGFIDTHARGRATWGTAMAPELDPHQPIDVELSSKNFRIAALLPMLSQSFDELDGRLDAAMRVSLEPQTGGANLSGTLNLKGGLVEASAGGGELHDVSASVRFNPDGTVVVDRLSAAGLTGRLEGSASARFDGTRFQSAKAIIVIPNRSAIPVTVGGAEIGNVDGRIEVSANAAGDGKGMSLAVQIPRLHVALPEGTSSDVQGLGAMENVHIGAHKGSRTSLLIVPLDPTQPPLQTDSPSSRTDVAVNIGDIEVARGTDLKVDLNGTVHVESGVKTQVTGQIHLQKGGLLNVQGRNFEVEGGTVTFTGGDPANPEIVVNANWTAEDGTIVTANFVGPLKTGKVTLSSQPPLPKEEVVELLLYGTSSGQQAQTPPGSTENTAIATAGGEAAQPLNHALNQLGLGAVTAKVDTSESATPKPEVEVQIAKGISLQLAYVLGVPPPGVNPDTTLVTVDWRFLAKWSLESTVGNLGTTIFDLIWQSRY